MKKDPVPTFLNRSRILLLSILFLWFGYGAALAQTFPNPATLSTGQGPQGAYDPIWTVSEFWYPTNPPPNPMTLNFTSALINYNCAPGAWVDAASLPPPVNNGNWITGPDANCATNTSAGYRYFRLTLNLPPDCNGFSVTTPGAYTLSFDGYVDNQITNVYINGNPTGISGGSYAAGSQLSFTLTGPWVVGTNYVDILVYNFPNGGGANPYGLLLVANANSPTDTDQDGVPNIDDLCPCDPGNNSVGCTDPANPNGCDINQIRQAFTTAGCTEMVSCVDDCSMYFLNPQSMSGSQAQAFAQSLGANLVSVQSAAENQCIVNSLNDMNQSGVIWIGFSDEVTEGNFVWYDQAPVAYTNWAPGEPNQAGDEDCVQIYPDGRWNDLSCASANAQSIIEVNLCPTVNSGADVTICNGATANLNAANALFGSAPYTYTWSNGPTVQPNPVAPTTTTNYTVQIEDRYSCVNTDMVTVNVNQLPNVSAGPDVTVCPQETVTLSGSGANTYGWTGGITNGTPFMPATATATYIVTGTDANTCQDTDTVNVYVELDGCPNFPNTYTCNVDPIRQAFTNAGCIEMVGCVDACSMYFLNPQSMSGSQAQTFAQTLGANLVSVQSAAENQCIINSLNNMGQAGVIWIGFSDEITEGTYVWYDQAPIVYTNWAPGEPNQSGDEDCVQIYANGTWNDLSCASANAKSVIEVNLCPVINAGADVAICLGDTAQLMASNTLFGSSPYTYEWSNGPTVQPNPVSPTTDTDYIVETEDRYGCNTADTVTVTVNPLPVVSAGADETVCAGDTLIVNGSGATNYTWNNGVTDGVGFVPAASGTYIVTGTDGNGCEDTDTMAVTVNLLPNVSAGTDVAVCDGDTLILEGSGAISYTWDNGVTDSVGFVPAASGTYTVTGTDANGCENTDAVDVTVNTLPIVDAGADVAVCAGDTLILNGSGATSYTWDNSVTDGVGFVPAASATYTVTGTDGNGCEDTDAIDVTVNALPPVDAGPDVDVCDGDTVTLSGLGATGYTWDNGVTDGVAFVPAATNTYTVTGTDGNGCENTDDVVVTVNPLPAVNAGADQLICTGASITLSGSGATGYTWDNGVTDGVGFIPTTTNTYTVTGTDGNGCENTDQVTITVSPAPPPVFAPDAVGGCSPFQVTFTEGGLPGAACLWNFGNGSTSVNCGSATTTFIQEGCYDVTLTVTNADGCISQTTQTQVVCVHPNPEAAFVPNPLTLNQTNSTAVFINQSEGANTYIWNFGDGTSPNGAMSPTHTFPVEQTGTYQVMLIAISQFGCVDTTYVDIEVDESVMWYVPNAFTPGVNDIFNPVFKPVFSSTFPLEDYSMVIYNRWGEPIFSTSHPDEGWDGRRADNKNLVEGGAYVWKIDFSNPLSKEYKTLTGVVYLVR